MARDDQAASRGRRERVSLGRRVILMGAGCHGLSLHHMMRLFIELRMDSSFYHNTCTHLHMVNNQIETGVRHVVCP